MLYEVSPQGICYIPLGMMHQCQFFGNLLVINIAEDMMDKKDTGILSYPLIIQMQVQIMELVRLIQAEIEQNPESKMEIAAMVGYSSNSTLTRAFHEITGTTPKKYRAELALEETG